METKQLLEGIARGDSAAQHAFYREYAERIAERARRILWGLPPFASGTEVAQSVLGRFLVRAQISGDAECGRLHASSREHLESLLQTMTLRRALNERRKVLAKSRVPTQVIDDDLLVRSEAFVAQFGATGVALARECLQEGATPRAVAEHLGLSEGDCRRQLDAIQAWLAKLREQPQRILPIEPGQEYVHEVTVIDGLVKGSTDPALVAVVRDCLEALEETTRTIVVMRLVGGYTLEEIADHVELSVPTIRHRLNDVITHWQEQSE